MGGVSAFEADYKIPLKHGVDQCIGDTMGPGGIFRALRSIPVTVDMANDMKELCPDALLLNYVNPMAMICWALGTTGVQFVGLCHGVQTTLDLISGYVGVPKTEIDYLCAGINHMGWFLQDRAPRATTSTRCCASASSSPNTTSTRRCAARCSATSATS